jgi:hypothetical protein
MLQNAPFLNRCEHFLPPPIPINQPFLSTPPLFTSTTMAPTIPTIQEKHRKKKRKALLLTAILEISKVRCPIQECQTGTHFQVIQSVSDMRPLDPAPKFKNSNIYKCTNILAKQALIRVLESSLCFIYQCKASQLVFQRDIRFVLLNSENCVRYLSAGHSRIYQIHASTLPPS